MSYENELRRYKQEQDERRQEITSDGKRIVEGPEGREVVIDRVFSEKVNFAYRLDEQIRNCQFAWLHKRAGYDMFTNSVLMLYRMIPPSWIDKEFHKSIETSYVIVNKSGRKLKLQNYFDIFNACIALFDRRGLLFTEQSMEVIF